MCASRTRRQRQPANPGLLLGFVGGRVAVDPEGSLIASAAIDFVPREASRRHVHPRSPGETKETIRFAREINPHTVQVSIVTPCPGTALYDQAREKTVAAGRRRGDHAGRRARGADRGMSYPHLSRTGIHESVETFYRRSYFRADKIAEMLRSPQVARRRLREGAFLPRRRPTR